MSSKIDFTAKVRSEGKITIPVDVRNRLSINQGDTVKVSVKKDDWYEAIDWIVTGTSFLNMDGLTEDAHAYIMNATSSTEDYSVV